MHSRADDVLIHILNISAFGIATLSLKIPRDFNANHPFEFLLKKGDNVLFAGVFIQ